MKNFQIKFKTLLFLLMVGLAITSCSTEDVPDPDPQGNNPPITLDCSYFEENPNAMLQDDPEAPIDYIITCVVRIDDNLTIEPGVVIAFEQDAGLNFRGESSFKMNGTAAKPILFTGTEKTKGFWRGIYTESSNASNSMSYVTVDYAGGNEISHGLQASLSAYGNNTPIILDNCTFSNSKNKGMYVYAAESIDKDEQNIFMTNCTFTKNDIPVQSDASRLRMYNGTNSFAGNDNDYVFLDKGNIYGDATWAKLDVPYLMKNTENGGFHINDGILTVEPGTDIMMTAESEMVVYQDAALIMVGTAAEPITIRGEQEVAGFWNYIYIFSESPLNEIGHVNIKHAGETTDVPNGAVLLGYSKFLNIHDVVFSDCFEYGISLDYLQAQPLFHLEYSNLILDNTSRLFSDWYGDEVFNP